MTIVEVAEDPPILEVSVLPEEERLLIVLMIGAIRVEIVVVARAVLPEKVLSPAKVCVVVETTPREALPAFGMLKVCVDPTELIARSDPAVPRARNCVTPLNPLRDVIPDPAIPRALHALPSYT